MIRTLILAFGIAWIGGIFAIFGGDILSITLGAIHAREQAQRHDMIKPRPMRELVGRTVVHQY